MEDYPRPAIPLHPVLSRKSLSLFTMDAARTPSILDNKNIALVTSGRVAIAMALRELGIKKGDIVLIPAYHCSSMVEPVLWAEAIPVFFSINSDTIVNIEDITNKITPDVKAILVTHYFGFHQPMLQIQQLCKKNNIALIEDCAHSFFGIIDNQPVGSFGDYSIASSMKFFPIYDGGCLVSSTRPLDSSGLRPSGVRFNIKSLLNTLEQAFEYNRLNILIPFLYWPLKLKDWSWSLVKKIFLHKKITIGPGSSEGGYSFDPSWIDKEISAPSRFFMCISNKQRIATERRKNYQYIYKQLSAINGARPLYNTLPENVVPYVIPVIFDNPEKIFPILKNQGVPILRFGETLWEGVTENVCNTSIRLSRQLFQFPCHQELTQSDIDWMVNTIKETLETYH